MTDAPRGRVLLWAPVDSPVGGHRVQLEMTALHLEREQGWQVDISGNPDVGMDHVDIVHGFGVKISHVRRARDAGLPVVLSPIYWSKSYRLGNDAQHTAIMDLKLRVKNALIMCKAAAAGRFHDKAAALVDWLVDTKALLESVDTLLPNSDLEAAAMVGDLHVTTPMHVVPNGLKPDLFPRDLRTDETRRSGVVSVGRIEPHKNQLGLIRALKGTGLRLQIVGSAHPDHPEYYERCRREGGPDVEWLPFRDQALLAEILGEARVHALPSYFETTGLANLEAALMGCRVVSTDRGFARAYFGADAWYCAPNKRASIRDAVLAAHASSPRPELEERVRAEFTWSAAARETASAYAATLARRRRTSRRPNATGAAPAVSAASRSSVDASTFV